MPRHPCAISVAAKPEQDGLSRNPGALARNSSELNPEFEKRPLASAGGHPDGLARVKDSLIPLVVFCELTFSSQGALILSREPPYS